MSKKHKSEHHEEHADESWLIPYADLLTLLLALFIVLFAMSTTDSKKFEEMSKAFNIAFNSGSGVLDNTTIVTTGEQMSKERENNRQPSKEDLTKEQLQAAMKQEQEDLEKLKKQIDNYIKTAGLTTQLETKLNQSQLMITISDNALFPSGSAQIKPEARSLALTIATMLNKYPGYEIVVSGHTDNEPISTAEFESNWDLSSSRAIRFMDILLSSKKLDPKLFSAIGYGEYRPVDSNANALGRSKNRRVEVSIIRKFTDPDKSQNIPATPK
ncbi:flagellar motor protein MotB [Paenibacillus baekrokdamisoli]|uniref:Flagellar motor protein MotB n=1 Tax=Paenibacillus baekrokdamisoli TaxID=1712516 RepID=A0A3G9JE92_9BACL|nr:flagellar motor protein MotB [Paenibacillus baekrokdamisoli]MBB3073275.1 chemotaxis protein MotB [Paenibacillus baekrokdamisoli]BBH23293.1 flagellar motor protein MotB [Paenibacillus baekrokdamisoli]